MAAAGELTALGRCWLWLLLGLQAVSGRSGESRSGLSAAAASREKRRGCDGGGARVRRVPQREAGAAGRALPAQPRGAGRCLVPLLPPRPPLRSLSLSEGVLRFCPCPPTVAASAPPDCGSSGLERSSLRLGPASPCRLRERGGWVLL